MLCPLEKPIFLAHQVLQSLVGCKNQALSENYAKQLYTRKYLRGVSVTGRLGDIQVNEDGSKTIQIYLYPYVSMNRVLFHHPVPILDDLKHHQYWQSFVLPK
jgi:hypothetical protein